MSISDAEAKTVHCPTCNAKPNESCVYVWPNAPNTSYTSTSTQRRVDVGKRTRRVHNDRRHAVVMRSLRISKVLTTKIVSMPTTSARREIASAERRWEYDEFMRLHSWLAMYGHIFREK